MSVVKIMLAFLLLYAFLGVKGSEKFNLDSVVYVSLAHGQTKTDSCGSKVQPCKALQFGINKLAWGGVLYIDGDETASNPYSCELSSGKLVVKRSLHVRSYNTMAHISCPNGFTISADNGSIGLDATITGVQFKNTVLYLRNVTNVTIQDCVFLESSPAIDLKTSNGFLKFYSLSIKRSLFMRNQGCIDFQLHFDKKSKILIRAILKLISVSFEENIAKRESVEKGGLVFVNLTNCYCTQTAFESIWKNVTANRNSINNTKVDTSKSSSRRKRVHRDPILKSLYVVYACDTTLKFNQVKSDHNRGLRFLALRSRHSSVRINKSCFHGHRISGPGGVMYIPDGHSDVGISDSDFIKNTGSIGGVIHIDGGDSKTAKLTLSNVNIRKCSGTDINSVISVGDAFTIQGIANVLMVLDGVLFERCHTKKALKLECGLVCLKATRTTDVIIHNSIFQSNGNVDGGSVLYVIHSPEKHDDSIFNLQVTKSHFDQNICGFFLGGLLNLGVDNPSLVKQSRLVISDSVFTNNTGHVIVTVGVQDIMFHNLTCNYTILGSCYIFSSPEEGMLKSIPGLNNTLIIEKSTFSNNEGSSIFAQHSKPYFVIFQVRDTVIKENIEGNQVFLEFGQIRITPLTILNFTVQVIFERVYFISNINKYGEHNNQLFYINVPMFHEGNFSLVFRQSVFRNNFYNPERQYAFYERRSLFLFETMEDGYPGSCEQSKHPTCMYRHTLRFNEVIFENNTGPSFIVYITNGKTSFTKCLFKNNYSHEPKVGAHFFVQDGTASVEFDNTTFIQTEVKSNYFKSNAVKEDDVFSMLFVFAGASGPLIIRNSKFVTDDSSERVIAHLTIQSKGYVYIDNFTELLCPVGSYMDTENGSHVINQDGYDIILTRLKFICKMCGVGKYTLERGSYKGRLSPTKCIESCPFGADCTWNIQSRPNFWGYYTSSDPPQLNFTRCHEKYCHVPRSLNTNTSVYNACFGNRTGIMCGACKEGFTEGMFNHKCRPYDQCKDTWFWVIAGIYSIIMACYFLFKPPVMFYLLRNLLWFRKKKPQISNSAFGEEKIEEHGGHGYSKIIFYFYQVADLLMIESASEILYSYNLITSVISFYNFDIELTDSKLGCPFPGLTAVTKELFRSAQVFAVMAFILLFYFLHWLLSSFKTTSKPVFAPYLAAIIEVLLLGYERLGHTSLKLLNCIPLKVGGMIEWRLVLDGNVKCWSNWWQYGLIAYDIIFVIPFLLVLLMGTSRLRCQKITAGQFVAACFVPLPFITYWLIKICFRRENAINDNTTQSNPDKASRKALLEVLQEPFRQPDRQSRGAYYWESILIGRRLIFLCLYSFISTPMLRMLFMTLVCIAIPVHNIIVMPYKDRKTNIFGITLLFMHVAIAIINLCKSVFITIGVTAVGPTRSQIEGLQLFEVALLGILPCTFMIIVVATLISQVFRFTVFILGLIQQCIKHDTMNLTINNDDEYRTLLNPSEEE